MDKELKQYKEEVIEQAKVLGKTSISLVKKVLDTGVNLAEKTIDELFGEDRKEKGDK